MFSASMIWPPCGSEPEAAGVSSRQHGVPVLQKSQPPEILFIDRIVQLPYTERGRAAIVIPNGILNNPALGYVRHLAYEPMCRYWLSETWP